MSSNTKWRPSSEIRAELAELVHEGEAINAIGEESETGLDELQQARWDELMSDEGLVADKQAELDSADRVEDKKKELALAKALSNPRDPFENDRHQNGQTQARVIPNHGSLKAFKDPQDAYDAGMWFRAMLTRAKGSTDPQAEAVIARRGWGFQAATEGTNTDGGFTVPDIVSSTFVEFRNAASVIRPLCTVMQMSSDTLNVPKMTSGPTVQYPGEATAATATDQVWAQIALVAVERAILTKVSNPLAADSLINFVDNVISRMGYQFAYQEDNEAINGDGSGTYGGETGLLSALGAAGKNTAATGTDTWPELDLQDFHDTMAILPSQHGSNPTWVCSNAFYHTVILRLLAAGGGNTIAALEGGGSGPSFMGYPVALTDHMPTATAVSTTSCLFGTFSDGVIIGDRESLSVMTSEHRYFEERNLGILGASRYDINVHAGGDGSDAGAYVGLVTAAS